MIFGIHNIYGWDCTTKYQLLTIYSSVSMKVSHSVSSPYRSRQELSAAYWLDRSPGLLWAGRFWKKKERKNHINNNVHESWVDHIFILLYFFYSSIVVWLTLQVGSKIINNNNSNNDCNAHYCKLCMARHDMLVDLC